MRASFSGLSPSEAPSEEAALANCDGALWIALLDLEKSQEKFAWQDDKALPTEEKDLLRDEPPFDEKSEDVFFASQLFFMRSLLPGDAAQSQESDALRERQSGLGVPHAGTPPPPWTVAVVPVQLKSLSTRSLSRVLQSATSTLGAAAAAQGPAGEAPFRLAEEELAQLANFARTTLSAASHEAWRCSLRDVVALLEGLETLAALEPWKEKAGRVGAALLAAGLEERHLRFTASLFFRALKTKFPSRPLLQPAAKDRGELLLTRGGAGSRTAYRLRPRERDALLQLAVSPSRSSYAVFPLPTERAD